MFRHLSSESRSRHCHPNQRADHQAEPVFGRDDDLDHRQRVNAKVIAEPRCGASGTQRLLHVVLMDSGEVLRDPGHLLVAGQHGRAVGQVQQAARHRRAALDLPVRARRIFWNRANAGSRSSGVASARAELMNGYPEAVPAFPPSGINA